MKFESEVVVDRPIDEVFSRWSELERYPEWFDSSIERRKLTDGPLGVGTTYHAVEKMPGKRIEFTLEIVAFEPYSRIAARLAPPANAEWDARFETVESGTRLTLRSVAHLSGIMGLLSPLMARWAARTQQRGLDRFKAALDDNSTSRPERITTSSATDTA